MIPTDPQDDSAAELPDGAAASMQPDPNRPSETQPEPEEESDEEWMRRFIEENIHLASPPVVRPSAPPPQPWDGPRSQWEVPDHLSMPHPNGGYMAMALMSRTMDDLDEVTSGKRAATYEEVDKYFGHALIAEGLVPFTYTADKAIHWWKAGGYRVLGNSRADTDPSNATITKNDSALAEPSNDSGTVTDPVPEQGAQALNTRIDMPESSSVPAQVAPLVPQIRDQDDTAGTEAYRRLVDGNGVQQPLADRAQEKLLPEADIPLTLRHPQRTFKVGSDWVIAARIGDKDISRLSGRDIIATPEIKAVAEANIPRFTIKKGKKEILAYGYLMPEGTVEIRDAVGKAKDTSHTGWPSGPGKVIFGIHGHPAELDRMVDDPSANDGFGDTKALFRWGIPMATVYDGKIAWHEMSKGQLTFTVPASATDGSDLSKLQGNLDTSQKHFLKPKKKEP